MKSMFFLLWFLFTSASALLGLSLPCLPACASTSICKASLGNLLGTLLGTLGLLSNCVVCPLDIKSLLGIVGIQPNFFEVYYDFDPQNPLNTASIPGKRFLSFRASTCNCNAINLTQTIGLEPSTSSTTVSLDGALSVVLSALNSQNSNGLLFLSDKATASIGSLSVIGTTTEKRVLSVTVNETVGQTLLGKLVLDTVTLTQNATLSIVGRTKVTLGNVLATGDSLLEFGTNTLLKGTTGAVLKIVSVIAPWVTIAVGDILTVTANILGVVGAQLLVGGTLNLIVPLLQIGVDLNVTGVLAVEATNINLYGKVALGPLAQLTIANVAVGPAINSIVCADHSASIRVKVPSIANLKTNGGTATILTHSMGAALGSALNAKIILFDGQGTLPLTPTTSLLPSATSRYQAIWTVSGLLYTLLKIVVNDGEFAVLNSFGIEPSLFGNLRDYADTASFNGSLVNGDFVRLQKPALSRAVSLASCALGTVSGGVAAAVAVAADVDLAVNTATCYMNQGALLVGAGATAVINSLVVGASNKVSSLVVNYNSTVFGGQISLPSSQLAAGSNLTLAGATKFVLGLVAQPTSNIVLRGGPSLKGAITGGSLLLSDAMQVKVLATDTLALAGKVVGAVGSAIRLDGILSITGANSQIGADIPVNSGGLLSIDATGVSLLGKVTIGSNAAIKIGNVVSSPPFFSSLVCTNSNAKIRIQVPSVSELITQGGQLTILNHNLSLVTSGVLNAQVEAFDLLGDVLSLDVTNSLPSLVSSRLQATWTSTSLILNVVTQIVNPGENNGLSFLNILPTAIVKTLNLSSATNFAGSISGGSLVRIPSAASPISLPSCLFGSATGGIAAGVSAALAIADDITLTLDSVVCNVESAALLLGNNNAALLRSLTVGSASLGIHLVTGALVTIENVALNGSGVLNLQGAGTVAVNGVTGTSARIVAGSGVLLKGTIAGALSIDGVSSAIVGIATGTSLVVSGAINGALGAILNLNGLLSLSGTVSTIASAVVNVGNGGILSLDGCTGITSPINLLSGSILHIGQASMAHTPILSNLNVLDSTASIRAVVSSVALLNLSSGSGTILQHTANVTNLLNAAVKLVDATGASITCLVTETLLPANYSRFQAVWNLTHLVYHVLAPLVEVLTLYPMEFLALQSLGVSTNMTVDGVSDSGFEHAVPLNTFLRVAAPTVGNLLNLGACVFGSLTDGLAATASSALGIPADIELLLDDVVCAAANTAVLLDSRVTATMRNVMVGLDTLTSTFSVTCNDSTPRTSLFLQNVTVKAGSTLNFQGPGKLTLETVVGEVLGKFIFGGGAIVNGTLNGGFVTINNALSPLIQVAEGELFSIVSGNVLGVANAAISVAGTLLLAGIGNQVGVALNLLTGATLSITGSNVGISSKVSLPAGSTVAISTPDPPFFKDISVLGQDVKFKLTVPSLLDLKNNGGVVQMLSHNLASLSVSGVLNAAIVLVDSLTMEELPLTITQSLLPAANSLFQAIWSATDCVVHVLKIVVAPSQFLILNDLGIEPSLVVNVVNLLTLPTTPLTIQGGDFVNLTAALTSAIMDNIVFSSGVSVLQNAIPTLTLNNVVSLATSVVLFLENQQQTTIHNLTLGTTTETSNFFINCNNTAGGLVALDNVLLKGSSLLNVQGLAKLVLSGIAGPSTSSLVVGGGLSLKGTLDGASLLVQGAISSLVSIANGDNFTTSVSILGNGASVVVGGALSVLGVGTNVNVDVLVNGLLSIAGESVSLLGNVVLGRDAVLNIAAVDNIPFFDSLSLGDVTAKIQYTVSSLADLTLNGGTGTILTHSSNLITSGLLNAVITIVDDNGSEIVLSVVNNLLDNVTPRFQAFWDDDELKFICLPTLLSAVQTSVLNIAPSLINTLVSINASTVDSFTGAITPSSLVRLVNVEDVVSLSQCVFGALSGSVATGASVLDLADGIRLALGSTVCAMENTAILIGAGATASLGAVLVGVNDGLAHLSLFGNDTFCQLANLTLGDGCELNIQGTANVLIQNVVAPMSGRILAGGGALLSGVINAGALMIQGTISSTIGIATESVLAVSAPILTSAQSLIAVDGLLNLTGLASITGGGQINVGGILAIGSSMIDATVNLGVGAVLQIASAAPTFSGPILVSGAGAVIECLVPSVADLLASGGSGTCLNHNFDYAATGILSAAVKLLDADGESILLDLKNLQPASVVARAQALWTSGSLNFNILTNLLSTAETSLFGAVGILVSDIVRTVEATVLGNSLNISALDGDLVRLTTPVQGVLSIPLCALGSLNTAIDVSSVLSVASDLNLDVASLISTSTSAVLLMGSRTVAHLSDVAVGLGAELSQLLVSYNDSTTPGQLSLSHVTIIDGSALNLQGLLQVTIGTIQASPYGHLIAGGNAALQGTVHAGSLLIQGLLPAVSVSSGNLLDVATKIIGGTINVAGTLRLTGGNLVDSVILLATGGVLDIATSALNITQTILGAGGIISVGIVDIPPFFNAINVLDPTAVIECLVPSIDALLSTGGVGTILSHNMTLPQSGGVLDAIIRLSDGTKSLVLNVSNLAPSVVTRTVATWTPTGLVFNILKDLLSTDQSLALSHLGVTGVINTLVNLDSAASFLGTVAESTLVQLSQPSVGRAIDIASCLFGSLSGVAAGISSVLDVASNIDLVLNDTVSAASSAAILLNSHSTLLLRTLKIGLNTASQLFISLNNTLKEDGGLVTIANCTLGSNSLLNIQGVGKLVFNTISAGPGAGLVLGGSALLSGSVASGSVLIQGLVSSVLVDAGDTFSLAGPLLGGANAAVGVKGLLNLASTVANVGLNVLPGGILSITGSNAGIAGLVTLGPGASLLLGNLPVAPFFQELQADSSSLIKRLVSGTISSLSASGGTGIILNHNFSLALSGVLSVPVYLVDSVGAQLALTLVNSLPTYVIPRAQGNWTTGALTYKILSTVTSAAENTLLAKLGLASTLFDVLYDLPNMTVFSGIIGDGTIVRLPAPSVASLVNLPSCVFGSLGAGVAAGVTAALHVASNLNLAIDSATCAVESAVIAIDAHASVLLRNLVVGVDNQVSTVFMSLSGATTNSPGPVQIQQLTLADMGSLNVQGLLKLVIGQVTATSAGSLVVGGGVLLRGLVNAGTLVIKGAQSIAAVGVGDLLSLQVPLLGNGATLNLAGKLAISAANVLLGVTLNITDGGILSIDADDFNCNQTIQFTGQNGLIQIGNVNPPRLAAIVGSAIKINLLVSTLDTAGSTVRAVFDTLPDLTKLTVLAVDAVGNSAPLTVTNTLLPYANSRMQAIFSNNSLIVTILQPVVVVNALEETLLNSLGLDAAAIVNVTTITTLVDAALQVAGGELVRLPQTVSNLINLTSCALGEALDSTPGFTSVLSVVDNVDLVLGSLVSTVAQGTILLGDSTNSLISNAVIGTVNKASELLLSSTSALIGSTINITNCTIGDGSTLSIQGLIQATLSGVSAIGGSVVVGNGALLAGVLNTGTLIVGGVGDQIAGIAQGNALTSAVSILGGVLSVAGSLNVSGLGTAVGLSALNIGTGGNLIIDAVDAIVGNAVTLAADATLTIAGGAVPLVKGLVADASATIECLLSTTIAELKATGGSGTILLHDLISLTGVLNATVVLVGSDGVRLPLNIANNLLSTVTTLASATWTAEGALTFNILTSIVSAVEQVALTTLGLVPSVIEQVNNLPNLAAFGGSILGGELVHLPTTGLVNIGSILFGTLNGAVSSTLTAALSLTTDVQLILNNTLCTASQAVLLLTDRTNALLRDVTIGLEQTTSQLLVGVSSLVKGSTLLDLNGLNILAGSSLNIQGIVKTTLNNVLGAGQIILGGNGLVAGLVEAGTILIDGVVSPIISVGKGDLLSISVPLLGGIGASISVDGTLHISGLGTQVNVNLNVSNLGTLSINASNCVIGNVLTLNAGSTLAIGPVEVAPVVNNLVAETGSVIKVLVPSVSDIKQNGGGGVILQSLGALSVPNVPIVLYDSTNASISLIPVTNSSDSTPRYQVKSNGTALEFVCLDTILSTAETSVVSNLGLDDSAFVDLSVLSDATTFVGSIAAGEFLRVGKPLSSRAIQLASCLFGSLTKPATAGACAALSLANDIDLVIARSTFASPNAAILMNARSTANLRDLTVGAKNRPSNLFISCNDTHPGSAATINNCTITSNSSLTVQGLVKVSFSAIQGAVNTRIVAGGRAFLNGSIGTSILHIGTILGNTVSIDKNDTLAISVNMTGAPNASVGVDGTLRLNAASQVNVSLKVNDGGVLVVDAPNAEFFGDILIGKKGVIKINNNSFAPIFHATHIAGPGAAIKLLVPSITNLKTLGGTGIIFRHTFDLATGSIFDATISLIDFSGVEYVLKSTQTVLPITVAQGQAIWSGTNCTFLVLPGAANQLTKDEYTALQNVKIEPTSVVKVTDVANATVFGGIVADGELSRINPADQQRAVQIPSCEFQAPAANATTTIGSTLSVVSDVALTVQSLICAETSAAIVLEPRSTLSLQTLTLGTMGKAAKLTIHSNIIDPIPAQINLPSLTLAGDAVLAIAGNANVTLGKIVATSTSSINLSGGCTVSGVLVNGAIHSLNGEIAQIKVAEGTTLETTGSIAGDAGSEILVNGNFIVHGSQATVTALVNVGVGATFKVDGQNCSIDNLILGANSDFVTTYTSDSTAPVIRTIANTDSSSDIIIRVPALIPGWTGVCMKYNSANQVKSNFILQGNHGETMKLTKVNKQTTTLAASGTTCDCNSACMYSDGTVAKVCGGSGNSATKFSIHYALFTLLTLVCFALL